MVGPIAPASSLSCDPAVAGHGSLSSEVGSAIDWPHLARMSLGDRRLEAEVLGLFRRQADLLLARMASASPSEVGGFAHTLKGSARGIGAWRVAEAATAVELGASRPASIEQDIGRLADAVRDAERAIEEFCATQS